LVNWLGGLIEEKSLAKGREGAKGTQRRKEAVFIDVEFDRFLWIFKKPSMLISLLRTQYAG
jgi:hypothetical protein